MKKIVLTALFVWLCINSAITLASDGLLFVKSDFSVNETVSRFQTLIKNRGLTLFTVIDHGANAEKAGVELDASTVIIFGNPKAGSALMNCAPEVAIDLPQKVLIRQDKTGQVRLYYNDPLYLKKRFAIEGCDPVINKISQLLKVLADTAAVK